MAIYVRYANICTYVHILKYSHNFKYVRIYVCMYLTHMQYGYTRTHARTHTHTHTHTRTRTHTHTHTHTHHLRYRSKATSHSLLVARSHSIRAFKLANRKLLYTVCTIVSYGATCCCRFCFDFYELLM